MYRFRKALLAKQTFPQNYAGGEFTRPFFFLAYSARFINIIGVFKAIDIYKSPTMRIGDGYVLVEMRISINSGSFIQQKRGE